MCSSLIAKETVTREFTIHRPLLTSLQLFAHSPVMHEPRRHAFTVFCGMVNRPALVSASGLQVFTKSSR